MQNFDIALMGRGIRDVAHLTLQSIAILKLCKRGFLISPDQDFANSFRQSVVMHGGHDLPPLISLSIAYQPNRMRRDNYIEAASLVLEAATSEPPVAYL